MMIRRKARVVAAATFVACTLLLLRFGAWPGSGRRQHGEEEKVSRREAYPLVWEHIHTASGRGGAWYIPPAWLAEEESSTPPNSITDAAKLAARFSNTAPKRYLEHSAIPMIVHQTWRSTSIDAFPAGTLPAIESWLTYATKPPGGLPEMAYFMWDDEGIADLMSETDPELLEYFDLLPRIVEKSDIFRIVVCNMIGGVYADIDTTPLKPPFQWIRPGDMDPWIDSNTSRTYGPDSTTPVGLILGIEADTPEDGDSFWRMGYTYPIQLTQWALASAANQTILNHFLHNFQTQMREVVDGARQWDEIHHGKESVSAAIGKLYPVELTGPAAVTKAAMEYMGEAEGLRWQALSGLEDGGRGKVVGDTLILPITGFSPGRGHYGNMGSKPLTDEDARLMHDFQGSWRTTDIIVELGKACRTFLGGCKDWSKVAGG